MTICKKCGIDITNSGHHQYCDEHWQEHKDKLLQKHYEKRAHKKGEKYNIKRKVEEIYIGVK